MKPRPLKIAIVGLGHLHPRAYMGLFASLPAARVTAVVEKEAALRDPFCKEFGVTGYTDLRAMLKAEKPDAAAIFLPHNECPEAAVQCAKAGVQLMVEKPMAATVAGARRIVQAARQAGVKLTTGYCWRLHPVAQEFKRIVQSGLLGRIVGGEGRCAAGRLTRYIDGHSAWMLERARSGGGPMYNLGVHWIDLFRWILDDTVVAVSGRTLKVNTQYDIEDNSFAHLRFSNEALIALDISYTVPDSFPYGRDLYLSLRGTKGVISWAPAFEGQKDILFVCTDDPRAAGSPRRNLEFDMEPVKGYAGFMGREYVRSFIDAIAKNTTPPITGEDGVAALKVVEAIYKSDTKKQWVDLR
jgi:predicted dehydrogenase